MKFTVALLSALALATSSLAQNQDPIESILSAASSELASYESAHHTTNLAAEAYLSSLADQISSVTASLSDDPAASSAYQMIISQYASDLDEQRSSLMSIFSDADATDGPVTVTTTGDMSGSRPTATTSRGGSSSPGASRTTSGGASPTETPNLAPNAQGRIIGAGMGVAGVAALGLAALL